MRKLMLFVMMILCMCFVACNEKEVLPDAGSTEAFDSSAGVEEILSSSMEYESTEAEENRDTQTDDSSNSAEKISISDEFEESSLEWKGDKAELSDGLTWF